MIFQDIFQSHNNRAQERSQWHASPQALDYMAFSWMIFSLERYIYYVMIYLFAWQSMFYKPKIQTHTHHTQAKIDVYNPMLNFIPDVYPLLLVYRLQLILSVAQDCRSRRLVYNRLQFKDFSDPIIAILNIIVITIIIVIVVYKRLQWMFSNRIHYFPTCFHIPRLQHP
jgi:hypothetical protein